MSKLVSANFSRVFRNKYFWICLIVVCAMASSIAIGFTQDNPWCKEQISHETKRVCFKYTPLLAGIVAMFVSLFVGEEYGNKTIRNKVAAGYSKGKIYGANWLVCVVVGGAYYLLFFLIIALPIAPWAGLLKYNGNIVAEFLKGMFIDLFAIFAVVSIAVFISMLVKNRVASLASVMVMSVLLFLLSVITYDGIREQEFKMVIDTETGTVSQVKNPDYEDGVKRVVCQAIMDIQPFGQMGLVLVNRATEARVVLLPIYSCLIMALSTWGGACLFSKKDLE